MADRRHRRIRFVAALVLVWLAAGLGAQSPLDYQDRGDRWEGVKPGPTSGYDIALVSALADPPRDGDSWPKECRLRFYLAEKTTAHVVVRERRPKHFYWLDRVTGTWRPAALNEYTWSTAPVLGKLPRMRPADLGAVVRLDRPEPGRRERVAPAVLVHSDSPSKVEDYRFTFRTNGKAKVTVRIYRGDSDEEVHHRPQNREKVGLPFTVRWPSAGRPEGWYRLVVSGFFESNNDELYKEVRFYHKEDL